MTIAILEFSDINEASGDPHYPAVRRRVGLAIANTYHQIGETTPVRAVLVYNEDGTTGIHMRVGTAGSGTDAAQGDPYVGPNESAYFLIPRKDRSTSANAIYINALADT